MQKKTIDKTHHFWWNGLDLFMKNKRAPFLEILYCGQIIWAIENSLVGYYRDSKYCHFFIGNCDRSYGRETVFNQVDSLRILSFLGIAPPARGKQGWGSEPIDGSYFVAILYGDFRKKKNDPKIIRNLSVSMGINGKSNALRFGVALFWEGERLTLGINSITVHVKWTCVCSAVLKGRYSLGFLCGVFRVSLGFLWGFFGVSLGFL